jgi:competence protein ComGC
MFTTSQNQLDFKTVAGPFYSFHCKRFPGTFSDTVERTVPRYAAFRASKLSSAVRHRHLCRDTVIRGYIMNTLSKLIAIFNRTVVFAAISVLSFLVVPNAAAEKAAKAEKAEKPAKAEKAEKPENVRVERDSKEVLATGERLKAEKTKEEMRDKTHDNRYKIDKNTSVGPEKNGVSIKKTIP